MTCGGQCKHDGRVKKRKNKYTYEFGNNIKQKTSPRQ